ncbi:hypothetical protein M404DRAFT_408461 [Pisolithus tinctorius Marx 270]|uniref:Uncharacterized protein n=1 Tax=Pisolithus tinctorius Marx 270 TaxID=870435 RepID=A0A0C3PH95_PISTI|nr:hypothetical protein M404DRAFT_408461 [Pisolithus tinctorius Marx 270]
MSDYTNLWNLASAPSQFSQLPEDELLALLQKQFQPISHGADTPSDSNKDGSADPVSITKLSLSGVTPSTDDSSPSPSANNVDSVSRRQSHSSYPRQGNNHAQGDETPALKRKASDDDLDEEHNPKNKLAGQCHVIVLLITIPLIGMPPSNSGRVRDQKGAILQAKVDRKLSG